jgi:hypothetical protein
MAMSRVARLTVLAIVAVGLAVAVAELPPLPQDPAYHRFADQRSWFGIPNTADVGSNLVILAAGVWGLAVMWRTRRPDAAVSLARSTDRWLYWRLYLAAVLAAVGSIYYHLAPDDHRLLWDRLPLALLLATFAAIVIAERIGMKAGLLSGLPLLLLAVGTVLYWYAGETRGAGDLRPYLWLQLAALFLIPLTFLLFDSPYPGEAALWWSLLVVYALAKGSEQCDHEIFNLGHLISGHTLKHLLAAVVIGLTVRIRLRREGLPVAAAR